MSFSVSYLGLCLKKEQNLFVKPSLPDLSILNSMLLTNRTQAMLFIAETTSQRCAFHDVLLPIQEKRASPGYAFSDAITLHSWSLRVLQAPTFIFACDLSVPGLCFLAFQCSALSSVLPSGRAFRMLSWILPACGLTGSKCSVAKTVLS